MNILLWFLVESYPHKTTSLHPVGMNSRTDTMTESNYGQSLKTLLEIVTTDAPILWLLRRFYFLTYNKCTWAAPSGHLSNYFFWEYYLYQSCWCVFCEVSTNYSQMIRLQQQQTQEESPRFVNVSGTTQPDFQVNSSNSCTQRAQLPSNKDVLTTWCEFPLVENIDTVWRWMFTTGAANWDCGWQQRSKSISLNTCFLKWISWQAHRSGYTFTELDKRAVK